MSGPVVRVGLAGAGWVARHHLDAWARLSDRAKVVAVADPYRPAAEARAERYGIPSVYASVERMLDEARLDAVDIAAPREHHVPICRLAAARGLHILCQKPLAPTLHEARGLIDEIGGRARLMVHENWRFRPHYRTIRSWIDEGHVGRVRTVVLEAMTSGLLPDARGVLPALARQPMLAGLERMLVMEVMIHHVDVLRFLVGPLRLEAARIGKRCEVIRGEDRAALLLRGPGGASVSLIGDFMAHGHPATLLDRLEIHGTAGAVSLRGAELRLLGSRPASLALDLAADYRASYLGAITHFLDRLADGGMFETAPNDNLKTLAIVDAAYRMSDDAVR